MMPLGGYVSSAANEERTVKEALLSLVTCDSVCSYTYCCVQLATTSIVDVMILYIVSSLTRCLPPYMPTELPHQATESLFETIAFAFAFFLF